MTISSHKSHIITLLSQLNFSKGQINSNHLTFFKNNLTDEEYKILIYGNKKAHIGCNLISPINCWCIKSILDYWKDIRKELSEENYNKSMSIILS